MMNHEIANDKNLHMFAYGSNMCTPRIRARVPSASVVATGYLTHYRLAFHKRGRDGSGKADAEWTGDAGDRVWGVVYRIKAADRPLLDACEQGYALHELTVHAAATKMTVGTYCALGDAIDPALKPFTWYQRFVLLGAQEHGLPRDYIEMIRSVTSIVDADASRHAANAKVLGE